MSDKKNCWEIEQCGRQPGGHAALERGVCPAASATHHNGVNGGVNAGRICWAVSGTFCGGTLHGQGDSYADSCVNCKAFKQIAAEEGANLILRPEVTEE